MSASDARIAELQKQMAEFQALLSDGSLTSAEEIQIEDAILGLNRELSALRRSSTVSNTRPVI
jgi:hypothetical protein